eukprot:5631258-Heterocapsa_arctica.AAC.1
MEGPMVRARARDKAESNARDRARTKSRDRNKEDGPQGELVPNAKAMAKAKAKNRARADSNLQVDGSERKKLVSMKRPASAVPVSGNTLPRYDWPD